MKTDAEPALLLAGHLVLTAAPALFAVLLAAAGLGGFATIALRAR